MKFGTTFAGICAVVVCAAAADLRAAFVRVDVITARYYSQYSATMADEDYGVGMIGLTFNPSDNVKFAEFSYNNGNSYAGGKVPSSTTYVQSGLGFPANGTFVGVKTYASVPVNGGTFPPVAASLTVLMPSAGLIASGKPLFTGDSYGKLTSVQASQPLTLTINGLQVTGAANAGATATLLVQGAGSYVYSASLAVG